MGSKEDAAIVNRGGAGPGWSLSNLFYAWSGLEEGALPVCRFYTQGANSHFYTASPEDCAYLKSLNPANVYASDQWTYEGIAFYAKLPINGVCSDDSVPVYRVYNNRWRENDSNHRFVTSVEDYQPMIAKGWVEISGAFCVPFISPPHPESACGRQADSGFFLLLWAFLVFFVVSPLLIAFQAAKPAHIFLCFGVLGF